MEMAYAVVELTLKREEKKLELCRGSIYLGMSD